jgi:Mor family transcriptional regulator
MVKYLGNGAYPVGAMFVPSALSDAVQGILSLLYSGFCLDTQTRNQQIRERYAAGERLSDLAREFGISPQRVYQIVHFRDK